MHTALCPQVVKSLGLDIQEAELQDMIDEFDHDRDGMISQQGAWGEACQGWQPAIHALV